MSLRIALFGTSWWADAMYFPAVAAHPEADVVAVCGRNEERARRHAETWEIDRWFTDPTKLLNEVELDAAIIATPNDSHYELATQCLERDLHLLCEKPLALNADEAADMVARAAAHRAITLVPFTYRYMPVMQWVKRLIDQGFVGQVRHLNLRYYTGYAHDGDYLWRFDRSVAGSGVIGDLGSHWVHIARWLLEDSETEVSAFATSMVPRASRPDGSDYDVTEDSAAMTVCYSSGAYALLQVSSVCWEPGGFGQSHQLEVHGDGGTLHAVCDWNQIQEVRGARWGEAGPLPVLPIPDDIWHGAPRARVHDTYRFLFRETGAMTRGWIDGILAGKPVEPDFAEGLAVQLVLDAAVASAANGSCRQPIAGPPAVAGGNSNDGKRKR